MNQGHVSISTFPRHVVLTIALKKGAYTGHRSDIYEILSRGNGEMKEGISCEY
jgi:hypothetical protein